MLRNNLDALPVRSAERRLLVQEVAHLHGVSLSTVRRALSQQHALQTVHRTDFNLPRILPTSEMELYCELVAALQQRTENKKTTPSLYQGMYSSVAADAELTQLPKFR
ncbi:hypothetical protein [Pseudomonas syringae]|uniref:hypothetical protein n=1 Tax=Pseudomonas syringae TaxID=317 RepID=UPI0011AEEAEE|nr:hypothetical protein [Pseudomonas syringae]